MNRYSSGMAVPCLSPLYRLVRRLACVSVLLWILCVQHSMAQEQEDEIVKAIEIQGLNKVSREKVLRALPAKVGKPFRPREPGEIIHRVYELGYFEPDIKLFSEKVDGGIKLILVVKENPGIREIQFVGNSKIPTKALRAACTVKEGAFYSPDTESQIAESIERMYRAKGYSSVLARVERVDRGTSEAVVQVIVDEGGKLQIKDLVIRGNEKVPGAILRMQLENKGSWLFIKNYYDSQAFENDLDIIRMYYIMRGYFDVRVRAGEFTYDPNGRWVSPVIEIQEGPRYRVGEVTPQGYTIFMREQILAPFESVYGKPYNAEQFGACIQKVKDLYGDEGYINAEVFPDYDVNPRTGTADFELRIEEHERITVRKVLIQRDDYSAIAPEEMSFLERFHMKFSPPVSNEVIQREVLLKPGEAYRRFQEVATVDRLRSLGVFETVTAEAALTDNANERDLLLNLEDGSAGNIMMGVGLSEWYGAYVYGSYINRNLFGEARHLRTSALLGTRDIQFRIAYLDRYFDLPGNALDEYFQTDPSGLVPFQAELYRDSLDVHRDDYEEIRTGMAATISRILRRGLVTEDYGVRAEYVQTDGDDDAEEDFGDYPVVSLRYGVVENTTDDSFWPTRGHILGGGAEVGVADGPLIKFTGRYATFKELYRDRLVYALNTKLGWMPVDADEIGISERFFMGGAGDLRGFAFRGAGPVDDGDDDLHIGGSTKLLVQNELRFPIYKQLKGFAFLDAGVLGEKPFDLDSPRVSAGVGARFSTYKGRQYGPRWKTGLTGIDLRRGFYVEVSLGVPIVSDSDDDEQYLNFIVGSYY